jgi:hypothetical protein
LRLLSHSYASGGRVIGNTAPATGRPSGRPHALNELFWLLTGRRHERGLPVAVSAASMPDLPIARQRAGPSTGTGAPLGPPLPCPRSNRRGASSSPPSDHTGAAAGQLDRSGAIGGPLLHGLCRPLGDHRLPVFLYGAQLAADPSLRTRGRQQRPRPAPFTGRRPATELLPDRTYHEGGQLLV